MISYNNNMDNTTQRGTLNQKEITLFSFDKSLKEQVRVSETIYLDKPYKVVGFINNKLIKIKI